MAYTKYIKKIIAFCFVLIFCLSYIYAKEDIDSALSRAAEDIVDKCNLNAILVVDDFESPTESMTRYIREQLSDYIYENDGLVQIVTREHIDIIDKELEFQYAGTVSEKTMLSIAERLGARFVVFGKLEELDNGYILRVRMLDVENGSYLFRKTYEFQYSSRTEQLLGRAPKYKKASVGAIAEMNKNSVGFVSPGIGISFEYSFFRIFTLGAKAVISQDFKETDNQVTTLEALGCARFYLASFSGEPVSGFFVEAQGGISTLFINSTTTIVGNFGGSTGCRFTFGSFYVEPEVRFGYPYIFGCGVVAGLRF